MQRIREFLEGIYYALPVQLIVVQVRYQKFSLFCWLILFLTVSNSFGTSLGIPYLFLEPEYNGDSNLFAMFLLGCGLGTFTTSYMIASYISNGYRFDFLALEYRPFFVFFLNNLLIPLLFVAVFSFNYLLFQADIHGGFAWDQAGRLAGMYLGLCMVTVVMILYFFRTNKSMAHVLGEKVVKEMKGGRTIIKRARQGLKRKRRVDYYISGLFSVSVPDPDDKADLRQLVGILNQNHGNALFLQLILLLLILGLGLLEENPAYHLPAGTSILLFFSIFLMVTGAITFWVRRFGPVASLALVVLLVVLNGLRVSPYRHPALGMNYEIAPRPYTTATLRESSSEEMIRQDIENTLVTLRQWKSDIAAFRGPEHKPKAVLICTSGGGLRAAYFTVRIFQIADSIAGGGLLDNVRLITGASGGMVGAAYYRELFYRMKLGEIPPGMPIYHPAFSRPMARDLLNRVCLKIATGLFLPTAKEQVGGSSYYSDRGWAFDHQLARNLPVFQGKRLGDYTSAEEQALIPQMIFSPVIINDGRKLYISAMPASYLTRNFNFHGDSLMDGVTGVDLMRFFRKHDADSLLFTTALRMNASFPFITPYVRMPSDPPMVVMDAGLADNYGLETTLRYLNQFSSWYVENTDSVLLLQIRDSPSSSLEVPEYSTSDFISQMLDPIGGTYNAYYGSSDLMNEQYIYQMQRNLSGKMAYSCFQYASSDTNSIRASLSWHLTKKEVEAIEMTLKDSVNQAAFRQVAEFLKD